jgi:hypothetical protein
MIINKKKKISKNAESIEELKIKNIIKKFHQNNPLEMDINMINKTIF